ncbi:hypothetical protein D3C71_1236520 [compost metagenome]
MHIVIKPIARSISVVSEDTDDLIAFFALIFHDIHQKRRITNSTWQYTYFCTRRTVILHHSANFGIFNVIHLSSFPPGKFLSPLVFG